MLNKPSNKKYYVSAAILNLKCGKTCRKTFYVGAQLTLKEEVRKQLNQNEVLVQASLIGVGE